MKRALAVFMAFAMMTSALPVTAMAEDTSQTTGTTGTERTVQSSMEISVDEIVKVDEDGAVTLQDVELTAVGTDFAVGETLTLTLSSGFGFGEEGEEDSGYADIQIVGDKLELTFVKATNACNISNMEIDALTAPVGAVASLTITGSNRGEATTDVAVVVEERKTVCFEVDSNDIVVNGEKVTIDRPDPAIWEDKDGNVMIAMRAASQILQKLNENVAVTWDTNAMVAEYTIGDKTVELTVGSDIAVVNGKNKAMETDCIMKNYADGDHATFPMRDFFEAFDAEDWRVTKGEGGFNLELDTREPYMFLDIPELQILTGGTVSYNQFNVSTRYRDFKLDEIVTLTISEGFEFVPAAIHDHDGTILQNVEWSADGKTVKVPVYKYEDTGFDMETMTIKATTAKVGDKATLAVSAANYPDVSQVIATVVDQIQVGSDISVDEMAEIEKNGTASLEDVEIEAVGGEFTTSETLTLTLSKGFAFVTTAKMDTNQADIVSFTADELIMQPKMTTGEIVIEDMKIEAVTAEVGDIARLTVTGSDRYADTTKIAKVVSEIKEEKTVLFEIGSNIVEVDGRKLTIDRPDSAIWMDEDENVMIAMRAASQILQKLNENVAVTWDTNAMVAEYTIGDKTVELTVGSDIAVVNGKNKAMKTDCIMKNYADGDYATFPMRDFFEAFGAEDWAVKNGDEGGFNLQFPYMELDIPKLQILKEGQVSYNTFGVDTVDRDFELNEIVTLTISEGFEFVPSAIHDHDGTVLQNVEWSADGKTVKVPVYKTYDHGFDMEAMTVKATTAKVGDEALLTVSAENYPDVSQVIAVVVDEITEVPDDDDKESGRDPYMFLDIPELSIFEGGTVSYSQFNVSTRYRDFKLDEIVTLVISDGFEFVPAAIHDHDGTILQNVVWSANKVEVPVYKYEDTGFDMEAMTIKATTAKIGDEALLTVSAVNYPDVSQVIATVADPNALNCSISVDEIVKVEEGDSVKLEDVEIDAKGVDFTTSETLTLTLSAGFAFVTSAKVDTNQADIVSFTKDELVLKPNQTTDEIIIEDLEIKVTTAEVGDTARLAIVGDKRVSTGVKVARVIYDEETKTVTFSIEDNLVLVDGRKVKIDRPNPAIWMDDDDNVMIAMRAVSMILQNLDDEVEVLWDTDAKVATFVFGDKTVSLAVGSDIAVVNGNDKKLETACVIRDYDDGGYVSFPMKGFFEALGATDWEMQDDEGGFNIEVSEAVVKGNLVLDVGKKTVKNGGKVSFDVFGIDKTEGDIFAEGDEVTLTLNEGFAFVEGPVYDNDGTQIIVKEWSDNKVVVYAPENPEHGFDMVGMTICATTAKAGDVATVTASVAGYDPVSEDVLTVVIPSSGGGGGSSKKPSAPSAPAAPAVPPVSAEATTTENGQTSTVDTTATTVQPVSQAEKETYQAQLKDEMPAATAVGDGAYAFAVAASAPSADGVSGNTSGGTKDPEKVSFDLSGQTVTDTAHLTLVKYVTQPDGTVEVVKLGGAFDPETNTFSAYADGEGVYDLVQDPDVTKITFAIGQADVSVNDAVHTNDVAPMLHNDKTMVPLRSIAETLGATVTWDDPTKTATMVLDGQVLTLTVDGENAMIMNERTMVPLRYIAESFGAGVRWIPSTQSIEIVK